MKNVLKTLWAHRITTSVFALLIWMILKNGALTSQVLADAKIVAFQPTYTLAINPASPQFGQYLTKELRSEPWFVTCPHKLNIGQDVQEKICFIYKQAIQAGFTPKHSRLVLGLIDHESAGTYDPGIRGDKGCSIGIGQFNQCAGVKPPKTFEAQVAQILKVFGERFQKHDEKTAICLWNSPRGRCGKHYVEKVIKASEQFLSN